jgi:putative flippase GtrA
VSDEKTMQAKVILQDVRKILLYAGNGIINTVVTYALFIVISNFVDYRVAIVIVYIPGILLSYFLNQRIVFNKRGNLIIFFIISIIMMCTNVVATWLLVQVFHVVKEVSQLIAIGIVFLLGYTLNKRYSFSEKIRMKK